MKNRSPFAIAVAAALVPFVAACGGPPEPAMPSPPPNDPAAQMAPPAPNAGHRDFGQVLNQQASRPPSGDPVGGFDAGGYCVDVINRYRATQNLPPLQRDASRESCAAGEAKKDGISGQAHGAFGACGEFAQNECPGWPMDTKSTLDGCLQSMWNEGPGADFQAHGHYLNMSSTKYTHVFCGLAPSPDGKLWVVHDFY